MKSRIRISRPGLAVGRHDGAVRRVPAVRRDVRRGSAALGFDLWALVRDGPAEELNQTVNTQPVMLTAGIAFYRAWREPGELSRSLSRATAWANTPRWWRRCPGLRGCAAAGALSRAGDAGGGAEGRARWRRSWASMTRRCARCARKRRGPVSWRRRISMRPSRW